MTASIPSVRKPLILNDGTRISVQAGQFAYCNPREDNAIAYASVECRIEPASAIPDDWQEHADEFTGTDRWRESSIFVWVPARKVLDFIFAHGGIANGQLPPLELHGEPSMES